MGQTLATNRKALRDYLILERFECGISLKGGEVKSMRAGKINFKDSFARIDKGEVFLHNFHIEQYTQASYLNEETSRQRRLLMHKREIKKLGDKMAQQSLALVPTKVYFNKRGYVKLELGLGKGRKSYDKREVIKNRKVDRDIDRAIKQHR
jgi:SsrA-binding protein